MLSVEFAELKKNNKTFKISSYQILPIYGILCLCTKPIKTAYIWLQNADYQQIDN